MIAAEHSMDAARQQICEAKLKGAGADVAADRTPPGALLRAGRAVPVGPLYEDGEQTGWTY